MRFRIQQNLSKTRELITDSNTDVSQYIHGYGSEDDFLKDLILIRDSLHSHGDQKIADLAITDLIRLVESFGFYLIAPGRAPGVHTSYRRCCRDPAAEQYLHGLRQHG